MPLSPSEITTPLILAFNPANRLAVSQWEGRLRIPFSGRDAGQALDRAFPGHTPPVEMFRIDDGGTARVVMFSQTGEAAVGDTSVVFRSIEQLESGGVPLAPDLAAALSRIGPYLIEIPYLHLGENDYIYKFRVERDRNRRIYEQDAAAKALYQSRLCEAIKSLARTNERTASRPARLDFGHVRYLIPSHFGFCLGVKNAIERAYETLAENPDRRVFMLSELIHNPFVNEDLLRRGLRYLQTDKGSPFPSTDPAAAARGVTLWDTLTSEDVVIIPAFGATDEDKKKLVRKGLRVAQYDATCMLVEKVWKAARAFGMDGYTIVIHGKSEHEETKATFSNSRRHAPSIIIRNMDEARLLGEYIGTPSPKAARAILATLADRYTPGFDPARHLEKIAVVNQTTLLMHETAQIIDYFQRIYAMRLGGEEARGRVGGAGRRDTLCYATQVNQDALRQALAEPIDVAFVIGGKNSSNTYQLYRLCEEKLGNRAFFIQSEENILSRDQIEHFVFPASGKRHEGHTEVHPLWPGDDSPKTVLITGGASCPDGLIQQVINRINSFSPPERLRSVEDVLRDLRPAESS